MHEMVGEAFDVKQFTDEQPKILNEFNKCIDPDLSFFNWTGANKRFSEFELPSFNQPSGEGITERLDRIVISPRGDPGVFVSDRASMPQTGQLTARAKYHRAPVELPPALMQMDSTAIVWSLKISLPPQGNCCFFLTFTHCSGISSLALYSI